jgi:glucose-1-phosphate cytidylyltransferase
MKAVILAGGLGTRLAEETDRIPKPMVTIGPYPILWHIMKTYEVAGIRDFIICAGYKAQLIIEYFVNYRLHNSSVRIDLKTGNVTCLSEPKEAWSVTIVDTGEATMTGGRIKRVAPLLADGEPFCMTYGDGLIDLNLREVIGFHMACGRKATMTAVRAPARFGAAEIVDGLVRKFVEKPLGGEGRINGGYFVLEKSALDSIAGDETMWEREPLEALAAEGELVAYEHNGFWQPMDTLRDRRQLEELWESGNAPWKRWSQ